MKKEEFKEYYESRGWTVHELAERWGYSAVTRIYQIAAEVETGHKRAQAYIDMLHGLPKKKR